MVFTAKEDKTAQLFSTVIDVLKIVTHDELINHINLIKEDKIAFASFQDKICNKIVHESCIEIGITRHDLLNTKYSFNGKRVTAFAISTFIIKHYFEGLSFKYIAQNYLNNNVCPSNLTRYVNTCKNLKETVPNDVFVKQSITNIMGKIQKIFDNNKAD